MNRSALRLLLLMWMAMAFLMQACQPERTEKNTDLTPTPIPPTPTPAAEGDYRLTSLEVASSSSDEIDITGDGATDNGLESALKEMVKFLTGQITLILNDAVAEGSLSQEQATAIKASTMGALSALLSIKTVNSALESLVTDGVMLERLVPTGGGTVSVGYWEGTNELGSYGLSAELGTLNGTFTPSSMQVDAWGDQVVISLVLISSGSEPVAFDFTLEQCRTIELYDPTSLFKARLGGGISIAALQDLADEVLSKLGLIPFLDKQTLADLEQDLEKTLSKMADVELDDGDDAISVSLVYNAEAAILAGVSD